LFCFLFTCKVTKNFVTVGNSLIISSWRSINSIYSTAHILNRLSTPITFYAERNYGAKHYYTLNTEWHTKEEVPKHVRTTIYSLHGVTSLTSAV